MGCYSGPELSYGNTCPCAVDGAGQACYQIRESRGNYDAPHTGPEPHLMVSHYFPELDWDRLNSYPKVEEDVVETAQETEDKDVHFGVESR